MKLDVIIEARELDFEDSLLKLRSLENMDFRDWEPKLIGHQIINLGFSYIICMIFRFPRMIWSPFDLIINHLDPGTFRIYEVKR